MNKTLAKVLTDARNTLSNCLQTYRWTVFSLLLLFLTAVVVIGYFIPALDFGRPFGTDEYNHLFHTEEMTGTTSLSGFYETIGKKVSDPTSPNNPFNYPFSLWLYGSVLAKVTGMTPFMTAMVFGSLLLVIILLVFAQYADLFLEKKEQIVVALLFMLSMPNVALILQSYRPSVFVLPLLLLLLYIALAERPSWRDYLLLLVTVFMIAITHTGTYIFLITFSMIFFLLYCLFWGKFSKPMFALLTSTFFIYVYVMDVFPHIYPQYATKSALFLKPGNFLAEYLYLDVAEDLGQILYTNLFIQREFVYALIWAAFIFAIGILLLAIHRRAARMIRKIGFDRAFAILLPIQNLSHSVLASPIWIGPLQVLLSLLGWLKLDGRGKCLLLSTALVSLIPSMLLSSEGVEVATGALREISYLIVIIPITSALGLWYLLGRFDVGTRNGRFAIAGVLMIVLTSTMVIPVVGNSYYNPQITGEDYIINGMQWLSTIGAPEEKVVGYGYRTVRLFTGKEDGTYGLRSGTETRTFLKSLREIYFSKSENAVQDLYSFFGAKYVLTSDKLVANLGGNLKPEESVLTIDENVALDRIYASNDFGIYASLAATAQNTSPLYANEQFSVKTSGSTIIIESETYKVFLGDVSPTIRYIGTKKENYLGGGIMYEVLRLMSLSDEQSSAQYLLSEMVFDREIKENRIIYTRILTSENELKNLGTLRVIYTFYTDAIKREYIIANDWLNDSEGISLSAYLSTNLFVPYDSLILKDGYTRIDKTIYPSEDTIKLNNPYDTVYVNDGTTGIFIRYAPTAPRPNYLTYQGSTLYSATSMVSVGQIESIKPGAALHITQYVSIGGEVFAEESIGGRMSIELLPYPDGITPIVLIGSLSSSVSDPDALKFYAVNQAENLKYTEAADTTLINIRDVVREGVSVIGQMNTRASGSGVFQSFVEQDDNIRNLFRTARAQAVTIKGFMLQGLIYNLDTIRAAYERGLDFMITTPVQAPIKGFYEEGLRHPQMAQLEGKSTDLVLIPPSYPMSVSLSYSADEAGAFASWRAVIDSAYVNNDLALFLLRSTDLGNPYFSSRFSDLIAYARMRGLTFITPTAIADHYLLLQKVTWTSHRDLDSARIVMQNNNSLSVSGITFKVTMPRLATGNYQVTNGDIVRTQDLYDQLVLFITADIPAGGSTVVTVEPDVARKQFSVVLPGEPIEGEVSFTVLDEDGSALSGATVSVDSARYKTNSEGVVTVSLDRGYHQVNIEKAGYIKAEYQIEVKGRIYILTRLIGFD
ncbi:MAG: hypothetical protein APR53_00210 [Methanoculleus sp. SDB]|nr:MAG: hypothetical protein APR53_00210 [Methanoculleus sp. SDB]